VSGGPAPASQALDELPWPEVARRLAREPRLLLAVGALEQHGPHLPLGTNTYIADAVSRRLSARLGLLCAPALPYGVNLPGSHRFPGTAGLSRKTLHRALNELLAWWEDHGVSEFVIITAHRSQAHMDALLLALPSKSRTTVFDLFGIDVGDLLQEVEGPAHAGELETSLMLRLAPELVVSEAMEDAPPDARSRKRYGQGRTPTPPLGTRGILGHPTRASAETGDAILRRWLEALEAALRR
jgi:creatinine amidohydrolase